MNGGEAVNDQFAAIREARELAASLPPRRTMHCHPSVTAALRAVAPPPAPKPDFLVLGRIGDLCGIDVYENDEMAPGAWEIREGATFGKGKMEGGTVVASGVLARAQ